MKCFDLKCGLMYNTVCSVSTGGHRNQLVCRPVWLPGCQSVRNCQPPGKIHAIKFKSNLWNFRFGDGSPSSVFCQSFEPQSNKSWQFLDSVIYLYSFVKFNRGYLSTEYYDVTHTHRGFCRSVPFQSCSRWRLPQGIPGKVERITTHVVISADLFPVEMTET